MSYLFSEWDNAVGNLNVKMFTTEILTLIKKKKVYSAVQTWRVTAWTSAVLSRPRTVQLLCQSWRVDRGSSSSPRVMVETSWPFLGPHGTYSRRHLSVDTR